MNTFDAKNYWENRLRANYSVCGVGYSGLGKRYNEWLYRVRHHVFHRTVRPLGLSWKTTDVIDIGSGTGFYIDRWKEMGVRSVTGVDLTQIAIDNLQNRFPTDKFVQLDIGDRLDISAIGSFDIVSAFDVMFHIVDDDRYGRALENIHALLRPEGWFIFSDNFLHQSSSRAMQEVDRPLDEIQNLLAARGFEVVKRVPMFVLMNFPVDSHSKLRQFLWRAMLAPVKLTDIYGYLLGAALYPLELLLTSYMLESPATEIMLCKKVAF